RSVGEGGSGLMAAAVTGGAPEESPTGASEAMARPRTPAVRNSAPPSGTNKRRPAPRASIARDTLFALSGRTADLPPAVRSGQAAAVTRPASGRGMLLGGAVSTDALGSCIPDLPASSDVFVWMRNQG